MAEAAPPVADVPVAAPTAPIVESAPAAVAAPVADTPIHPAEVPSLLESIVTPGATPPAAEAPPAEVPVAAPAADPAAPPAATAPPVAEPPKAEVPPVAEPPKPAPIEWTFEAPETLKISDAQKTELTGVLNDLLQPREGETPSHAANRLLDLHAQVMADTVTQLRHEQIAAFNETRSNWRKEVLADEQIGGAGHNTAMGAIARMRDLSISDHKPGTPGYVKDAQEYEQFLRVTGAGDHPAYLRQLHRFAKFFDEPAMPPPNPKPPADIGRNPSQKRSLYAPKS